MNTANLPGWILRRWRPLAGWARDLAPILLVSAMLSVMVAVHLMQSRETVLLADVLIAAWILAFRQFRQMQHLRVAERQARDAVKEWQESESRYRLLAENVNDVIARMGLDGVLHYVSPASAGVLGYLPEQLTGRAVFDLMPPEEREASRQNIARVAGGVDAATSLRRCIRADGEIVWIESDLRLLRDPVTHEPREIILLSRDVTERSRAEERIRYLAATDDLTGLPNRRVFVDAVKDALAAMPSGGAAVMFIDLDRFKLVNDIHGHIMGDQVLMEAASRLRRNLPESARIARLGGDEFGVLLPDCNDEAEITRWADAMLSALSAPIRLGSVQVEIGGSIGISCSPRDGAEAGELLRTADIAMYRAKRGGGGCCFFRNQMETELKDGLELKLQLRQAIADGEVVPYYQPVVRLHDRQLMGFEVLARWDHPDRGILPPAGFVAYAEENGFVSELFASVLARACADARRWPGDLKIAVNISPIQLQDLSLSRTILNTLDATGLPPSRLELEVTESGLIRDLETARRGLATLRDAGIRIALDDFGTGYASVFMLKELKVDRLKIDRSFVQAVSSDSASGRYVAAIIGLADALGLETTAEGIEDEATMQRIADMGCALGQGFLFGRPMAAGKLESWLEQVFQRPQTIGVARTARAVVN